MKIYPKYGTGMIQTFDYYEEEICKMLRQNNIIILESMYKNDIENIKIIKCLSKLFDKFDMSFPHYVIEFNYRNKIENIKKYYEQNGTTF